MTEHSKNVALCYQPDMDDEVDLTMTYVLRYHPCEVCGRADGEPTMLVCDVCSKGYHMECLDPPLTKMPTGDWVSSGHIQDRDPQRKAGKMRYLGQHLTIYGGEVLHGSDDTHACAHTHVNTVGKLKIWSCRASRQSIEWTE